MILFHCDAIKVAIKLKQATLCHKGDPCLSVHHKTLETFEKKEKEKILSGAIECTLQLQEAMGPIL